MAYLVEENKTKWHITLLDEAMHHPHQGSIEQEKFTYVNGERPRDSISLFSVISAISLVIALLFLPPFFMPFFCSLLPASWSLHVLPHISFLTPSIIPLYSCIYVHVCGEMKLHVFYEDAGGANIGYVTTVSTDGKGEGGGIKWYNHSVADTPSSTQQNRMNGGSHAIINTHLFFTSSTGLAPFPGRGQ